MTRMPFKDTVTLYEVTSDHYGDPVIGEAHVMKGAYEQTTTKQHSDHQDFIAGAPRLYLPPEDAYLLERAYRIEGMFVQVNLFGGGTQDHFFEITEASPIRDTLLGNQVWHVECELRKITDFRIS